LAPREALFVIRVLIHREQIRMEFDVFLLG